MRVSNVRVRPSRTSKARFTRRNRRHVLRDETDRSSKRHRTRTCWSTGRGDVGAASPRVARLPADDEGLDVVPAIALGGVRDALLELSEELGQETGSACLALAREGTEEQRPSPCGHALDVFPREHRGIVVPVGVVETEQLGALEHEAGEAPAAPPRREPGTRRACATRPE